MKTLLASVPPLLAAVTSIGVLHAQSAHARAPYKKEFETMYVTGDADPNFAKAVEAAKCNICHIGKDRKDRNSYGKALAKHLQKGDEKDLPKVKSALEEVAKERSDPNKPDSPTFGQRIKSGKLPGA